MSRYISLGFRQSMRSPASPDGLIYLVTFDHPFTGLVRLSTDPTRCRSLDPLEYGTDHQGNFYSFILMGLRVPDDTEDASPSTTLVVPNVGSLPDVLSATVEAATVTIRAVRMRALDVVEFEYTDMQMVGAAANGENVSIDISRVDPALEAAVADRMTAGRFPGLHR